MPLKKLWGIFLMYFCVALKIVVKFLELIFLFFFFLLFLLKGDYTNYTGIALLHQAYLLSWLSIKA